MNYRNLLILPSIFLFFASNSQITVLSDNFESGTGNWNLSGSWNTTTAQKHGGSRSMADSPSGQYQNNVSSDITLKNGVNLDSSLDAELSFWAIYDIENGFDYVYLEVTGDNGNNWTKIATFNGENKLTPWVKYSYSLGGFIGKTSVKVRFRFESDPGYIAYGIYIDDLTITKDTIDKSPPLILHNRPDHYYSTPGPQYLSADVIDTSGVGYADLIYTVDGGSGDTINGIHTTGDEFKFTIPSQQAGSWVDYYIVAADTAPVPNVAVSDTFRYISGNHILYDNGIVSFVNSIGPSATSGNVGVAVRITIPGATQLVTALIRNYTDINNPNDSIDVHIWKDTNGLPGSDMVPPVRIFPEADLLHTHVMTRVDLRPFSALLSGISGDVFIGYTVPSGRAWTQYTTGGSANRSFLKTTSGWALTSNNDYHFRLVTDVFSGAPIAGFDVDSTNDPTISFIDTTKNNPTAWYWDFGDGGKDSIQNPSHTYTVAALYQVCLTAENSIGSDKYCRYIYPHNLSPIADFGYYTTLDPEIHFLDFSLNDPTSWVWDFGDGNPVSTVKNPSHKFDSNTTYQVCLKASNALGSDSTCKTLSISGYKLPIAGFEKAQVSKFTYQFTDTSLNDPSAWHWVFTDGSQESVQNPSHTYMKNGTFSICLVASNGAGNSEPYCEQVSIHGVGIAEPDDLHSFYLFPNPSGGTVNLEWRSSVNQVEIMLNSMSGERMLIGKYQGTDKVVLDLTRIPAGLYILSVKTDDETSHIKLIRE